MNDAIAPFCSLFCFDTIFFFDSFSFNLNTTHYIDYVVDQYEIDALSLRKATQNKKIN